MAKPLKHTLQKGSQGPDVALLQGWLNRISDDLRELLFAPLKIDGIFGTKTYMAVIEFQRLMKISADGIVGPVTWSNINDALLALGVPGLIPGSAPPTFDFTFTKNDRPGDGAWQESKAWDLYAMRNAINRYNRSALSTDMILVIFFEETKFNNVAQIIKGGGVGKGRGFGQMQTSDPEKQEYFAWAGLPVDDMNTPGEKGARVSQMMLASNEECVRIHVGYFNWLTSEKGKSETGILSAQVGSHTQYISLFQRGAVEVGKAWASRRRIDMIYALNYAPDNSAKKNGAPWPRYSKFWRFIIPDWSLVLGY